MNDQLPGIVHHVILCLEGLRVRSPNASPVVRNERPVMVGLPWTESVNRRFELSAVIDPKLHFTPHMTPTLVGRFQSNATRIDALHVNIHESTLYGLGKWPRQSLVQMKVHFLIRHIQGKFLQFVLSLIGLEVNSNLVQGFFGAQIKSQLGIFLIPRCPSRTPSVSGQLPIEQKGCGVSST